MSSTKSLVEGLDYVVRCLPFPNCSADGVVVSHPDIPCVYINSRVCLERQLKALLHELEHLANDDLYSEEPRDVIEGRMHD